MRIKAIGTITHNYQDGKRVNVDLEEGVSSKEWYFFTSRNTIWRVDAHDGWMQRNLLGFAFYNHKQNIEKFLNDPYWQVKYRGDLFKWTNIYEKIADSLLSYKENRVELIYAINDIYKKLELKNPFITTDNDGNKKLLEDVCPFTVFGMFNKGIKK